MKSPKEAKQGWERTLTRYFAALNVPLRWDYGIRRFHGVARHDFPRLNPQLEEKVWARMPEYINKYEKIKPEKQVIVFITNKQYGDSVDDSLVVMRMGTFAPLLKAFVDSDRERWVE